MLRISAKARLKEKGFLAGPFIETASPELVECLGLAGFDFAIIDCEHGPFSGETAAALLRAATVAGVSPIVRVRENDPGRILEALDIGAVGLHIPQIASADDARRAVEAARFPPAGVRGFNPFVRAGRYGSDPTFRREADEDTLLVLHIEGGDSVAAVDEILAVEGVDVAFLGPFDLSQSLGVPGEVLHPKVQGAMKALVEAAANRNVAVGCFANNLEQAKVWIDAGVSYLAYSVDTVLFRDAATKARAAIDGLR